MANSPEITCSKSTVYRHFQKGYYSASVLDLPRAVKFKARKSRKVDYVPAGVKIGRTYDDFLAFIADHHLERHVELDTVIGRIGGKVIMTVHFTIGMQVDLFGRREDLMMSWAERLGNGSSKRVC